MVISIVNHITLWWYRRLGHTIDSLANNRSHARIHFLWDVTISLFQLIGSMISCVNFACTTECLAGQRTIVQIVVYLCINECGIQFAQYSMYQGWEMRRYVGFTDNLNVNSNTLLKNPIELNALFDQYLFTKTNYSSFYSHISNIAYLLSFCLFRL